MLIFSFNTSIKSKVADEGRQTEAVNNWNMENNISYERHDDPRHDGLKQGSSGHQQSHG